MLRRSLALATLVALVSTGLALSWPQGAAVLPKAVKATRWTEGRTRAYAIDWSVRQTSAVPHSDGDVDGALALQGELSLTPLKVSAAETVLSLKLDRVDTLSATAAGQDIPTEGVATSEAYVTLDAQGAVTSFRFAQTDALAFRYLVQALAPELFPPLPEGAELALVERLSAGDVETRVAWVDEARTTLERRRWRFTHFRLAVGTPGPVLLDSTARFEFDAGGPLMRVEATERVDALDTLNRPLAKVEGKLSLRFVAERPASAQPFREDARPLVRLPGPVSSEVDVTRALLESRVGELTFDALAQALLSTEDPKALPDREAFVWQAAGLLELEPERCAQLVPLFDRAPSVHTQGLLVDLLVSAGHPQAQAAMRQILTSETARKDKQAFEELYQRLGLVAKPTRESVQLVLDEHAAMLAQKDDAGRRVRAFTLGSMASRLRGSEEDLATLAGEVLLDDYAQASSDEDRGLALRALGNAGDPRTAEAVTEALSSSNPALRADAAVALRKVMTPQATAALVKLLGDERSAEAQSAAFDALRRRPLGEVELEAIRDLVVGERLGAGAERMLLSLLAEAPGSPAVLQSLQALMARPEVAASYRVQARALLARHVR